MIFSAKFGCTLHACVLYVKFLGKVCIFRAFFGTLFSAVFEKVEKLCFTKKHARGRDVYSPNTCPGKQIPNTCPGKLKTIKHLPWETKNYKIPAHGKDNFINLTHACARVHAHVHAYLIRLFYKTIQK